MGNLNPWTTMLLCQDRRVEDFHVSKPVHQIDIRLYCNFYINRRVADSVQEE